MAAAYAALVSLRHIIEHVQHHPRPPISLHNKQVESLTEKVTFLQDFLEGYSVNGGNKEAGAFEGCIANAAYAAADIIESHIVDQILGGSTSTDHGKQISGSTEFYQALQKVIQDMDFIKKELMEIKEKTGIQRDQLHINPMSAGSSKSPSTRQNTMVGFDDVLIEIMDKLTGQQSDRQIIPIVGMGGIGKTTLARNIYVNSLIAHHFDILAWATISQEYNAKEILIQVHLCLRTCGRRESLSQKSEHELGEDLYKSLLGRRYLIIMDDMWSVDAWDKVKFFFPDNGGSRIVITTRLSKVAFEISGSHGFEMKFIDDEKSWDLFCKNVFGEESCPLELEEIGKKIAKKCKGLPLSIVVIGGFLAKSQQTQEYWEYIAENLNSIVNLEENEHCLKVLQMSYNQLPIHLKPCFLYMGIFPEYKKIRVSSLIKLWVAEGFLKPIRGKNLEIVAEEYLKDLIDRNLISVHELGCDGKIRYCKIHDLLRDLCMREGEKDKFICVTGLDGLIKIPQGISTQRRVGIHLTTLLEEEYLSNQVINNASQCSASVTRSLIWDSREALPSDLDFRLLRVLHTVEYSDEGKRSLKGDFQLINSRYLAVRAEWKYISRCLSSYYLWNLQTLVVNHSNVVIAPSEIWKMPQLRHVESSGIYLPDPPSDGQDDFVLGNLQTLLTIYRFKFSEEVVKRIPNIQKLKIYYNNEPGGWSSFCLNNLGLLHKLESFRCFFHLRNTPSRGFLLENLTFPRSLKKLTLAGSHLKWKDITTKIGSLPHLQVLKLKTSSFKGPEWETVEGQFPSLTYLLVEGCDLEHWRTDNNTHFPRLERLVLRNLEKLDEIPREIGEIPTLQSIELVMCTGSPIVSAKRILEEQEELGNVGLKVRVVLFAEDETGLESLASPNFQVENLATYGETEFPVNDLKSFLFFNLQYHY